MAAGTTRVAALFAAAGFLRRASSCGGGPLRRARLFPAAFFPAAALLAAAFFAAASSRRSPSGGGGLLRLARAALAAAVRRAASWRSASGARLARRACSAACFAAVPSPVRQLASCLRRLLLRGRRPLLALLARSRSLRAASALACRSRRTASAAFSFAPSRCPLRVLDGLPSRLAHRLVRPLPLLGRARRGGAGGVVGTEPDGDGGSLRRSRRAVADGSRGRGAAGGLGAAWWGRGSRADRTPVHGGHRIAGGIEVVPQHVVLVAVPVAEANRPATVGQLAGAPAVGELVGRHGEVPIGKVPPDRLADRVLRRPQAGAAKGVLRTRAITVPVRRARRREAIHPLGFHPGGLGDVLDGGP